MRRGQRERGLLGHWNSNTSYCGAYCKLKNTAIVVAFFVRKCGKREEKEVWRRREEMDYQVWHTGAIPALFVRKVCEKESKGRGLLLRSPMERKKLAAFIVLDQFGEIVGVCLFLSYFYS